MPGVTTVGKLYSNTCGYCVDMAPAWAQMENNINGKQTKFKNVIKFHNIEAANLNNELPMLNKTLVGQKIAEPNAFPALYKHENGKVLYYQGAREVGPMTQWVMGSPKKNTTKRRRTRGGKHSDRKHSDRKHSDRKHSDTRGKHSDTRGKHSDTRGKHGNTRGKQ